MEAKQRFPSFLENVSSTVFSDVKGGDETAIERSVLKKLEHSENGVLVKLVYSSHCSYVKMNRRVYE
ncbi:hypothetical protein TNIN_376901 [Trichonephila inaurata madagascariensis]|uniref:Uncharacterized protein n=1 Tax=Trichonephila inaurata madagascariensis TaxID=2747483 RepID=A0A8X6YKZ5_9ARAC|nr:hypothetical protein TNIN_376901 [Trichonephila inaurata madagascariensis]